MKSYNRLIYKDIIKRLQEERRFIQVLTGPRQVGKTTLAEQVLEELDVESYYASADEPTLKNLAWIQTQWEVARLKAQSGEALLVLDEIQKIPDWSDMVKHLWDEDTRTNTPLKVLLLGSSPLLLQQGLTESLAGRFEKISASHWSFTEMQEAFGWNLDQYVYFGGYPGAAPLIEEAERWKRYINDSLIETTISRDILLMKQVNKPALLRQLFQFGCDYSSQIISYQKMVGQLQDAGNTTTLAHYLELLSGAGMLTGLSKYSGREVTKRGSSPKLQILNTGLMSATQTRSFEQAKNQPEYWGRLVESAVGAHLFNQALGSSIDIHYWRQGSLEVDFVLQYGSDLIPIEVKSQTRKDSLPGLQEFSKLFKPKKLLEIGGKGIPLETFFKAPITQWL